MIEIIVAAYVAVSVIAGLVCTYFSRPEEQSRADRRENDRQWAHQRFDWQRRYQEDIESARAQTALWW